MKANIQDVLAYEIKKEIADRYFGFRKLIEEDSMEFAEKNRQYTFILEKRISFDLIRLYLIFKSEELIQSFLQLVGLPETLFYDPYLTESETIKQRVFKGVQIHGLTWRGRFNNLIYDTYERLTTHIEQYRVTYKEMVEWDENITQEIQIFQRNNDLGSILGFLRSLDSTSANSTLQGGMEPGIASSLDKKLKIKKPDMPTEHPEIPPLPLLNSIKSQLKVITKAAYRQNGEDFRAFFSNGTTSPWKLTR